MSAGRRGTGGFTTLELLIAVALLAIIGIKVLLVVQQANDVQERDSAEMVLEDQAMRVLEQIAEAILGADRETLLPETELPLFSEQIDYRISHGVENGEVVWGDPERVGLDDVELHKVTWTQNPETEDERRVVWTNLARELLGEEFANGDDDNGNGMVDETGLNFVIDRNLVTIRLTLERTRSDGTVVESTHEKRVTVRN